MSRLAVADAARRPSRRADLPPSTGVTLYALSGISLSLRVPAFSVVATGLSANAHALAGGSLPDLGLLALLAIGVGLVFSVMARREQSLARLATWLAGTEVVLHLAFSAGGHTHPPTVPGEVTGVVMATGHACVALAAAWWLRRGESAAWRLARSFLPVCRPWRCHEPPAKRLTIPDVRCAAVSPQCLVALAADSHRGPPSLA